MKSMDKMMKECTKPHALLHTAGGIGIGIVIIGVLPGLISQAVLLGFIIIVAAVIGEFMAK